MKENSGTRHCSITGHTSELLLSRRNPILVYWSHASAEGVYVHSPTSFYLDVKLSFKITAVCLNDREDISFFFSRSGPDQKGSSRHWGVQTNGCHVTEAERDRAPPTQRTEIWTPVMIHSSGPCRQEHPIPGEPPEHTSEPLMHLHLSLLPLHFSTCWLGNTKCGTSQRHLCEPKGLGKFSHLKWCEWGLYLLLLLGGVVNLPAQFSHFTPAP